MEEEGISYYVKHTEGHNTVVLTDSTSKHTATPGYETIPFVSPEQVVRPELEHISSWDFSREIQPGVYVHDDYDLERPSVELKTQKVLTAHVHAERLRGLRLPRPLPAEGGRRAVCGRADRRARQPVRDGAGGHQRQGHVRRIAVHAREVRARGSEPRAPDSGGQLRPGVQRLRGDAGRRGHELPVQLRRDVERAAVPAEAQHAEAVRAGAADGDGRRPGAATRSTPTSTGA